MTINHHRQEAIQRGARMLRTALGPAIARLLADPAVVEAMLNPDGRLWVDRLSEGLSDTGERLSATDGERIVRLDEARGNRRVAAAWASQRPGRAGRPYPQADRLVRAGKLCDPGHPRDGRSALRPLPAPRQGGDRCENPQSGLGGCIE